MTLDPATIVRREPERDRYSRPLIRQEDGTTVPYTRATTLAKALSDASALTAWKQRLTAYGLARRPDLVALAATATVDDRDRLAQVVGAAMDAAASDRAANMGTAVHSASEVVDTGGSISDLPDVVRPRVEAYLATIRAAHLVPVAVELFTVCDELRVAGTADRVYRLDDGRTVIGDLKTGKASAPRYAAGEWAAQLAVYAHGQRYDPATGARSPVEANLDPSRGVIVHVPEDGPPALVWLRLDWGIEAARLATRVRRFRSTSFVVDTP